jgi:photosystem II stability/assembly factor-like uncharacterized protein
MKKLSFILKGLMTVILFGLIVGFVQASDKKTVKEEPKKDPVSGSTFSALKFRSIGPAFTSGRIADIAVNPKNFSEYYVGVAAGGVWKTTNNGITWNSVFDNYGSWSVGPVVVDPNNPLVVWVGSGEYNSQRAIGYGDGVYKSVDGGDSFKNMGLGKSEHIGRIRIDPRNSDVVYVSCQGPLWGPGGDRGLFKTIDGGTTWNKILDISENTGVSDIEMDPRNPDVIYVSAYQRRRHVWTLVDGGPESAVYKTIDAGKTFNKINAGLPGGDIGRIGLAISPVSPDIVYAIVEAAEGSGGFFRTTNAGLSWQKMSNHESGSAQYYSRIYCDLWDADRVYSMETVAMVTDDGGATWRPLGEDKKHVDNHCFWMDPRDRNHYIIGCDGGMYESFDRAQTWQFKPNLPVTQFYRVAVDNDAPFYNVYGGTQDNNSFGGPSRGFRNIGVVNDDWWVTCGGDGFFQQVDPTNPDIVYSESQFGGLVRYDRKSGEAVGIQPQEPLGEAYHWNWNTPILISRFDHKTLYFAANKLFKSTNYGDKWTVISPDLTRQMDRNKLPVMGVIQNIDAVSKSNSTSVWGNTVALAESPLKQGTLFVGTDDGLIQVTTDDGKTWTKIESVPGVPDMTYVSCILADKFDPNTLYASFNNLKRADFKPYLFKSTDLGKTWKSLAANLPENGMVHAIQQDPVKKDLLFLGTEFGFWVSINGGEKWIQLKAGLPTIAIYDVVIQERENDLVLASFGRGFFILDDYTPLRNFLPSDLDKDAHIYPIKEGIMFSQTDGKYGQGHSYFSAPNPPYGVAFTYLVKDKVKTLKEIRKEAQAKARKDGTNPPYPTYADLRAEEEEQAPFLFFTIKDATGKVVKVIKNSQSTGMARVNWDYDQETQGIPNLRGSQANPMGTPPSPITALPGKYTVELARNVGGVITQLAGPEPFTVRLINNFTLPAKDRGAVIAFIEKANKLGNTVNATTSEMESLSTDVQYGKQLVFTYSGPVNLMNELKSLETQLKDLNIRFYGNPIISRLQDAAEPGLAQRMGSARYISANQDVPESAVEQYNIVAGEMVKILPQIQQIKQSIDQLKKEFDKLGYPWTPGREIPKW